MSSLLHFPWVTPEFPASPTRDWGKGYWALSNRTKICVPCRPAIQWGAMLGSLRTARLHHAFGCISMQLALAQPWRILFPQSHTALISGNTQYYMRANSLILFVRLRWSATYSLKSPGDCLFEKKKRVGGCTLGKVDFMLLGLQWEDALQKNNLFNTVVIFRDTHAANGRCIIHDFTYQLLPASSKEDFIL